VAGASFGAASCAAEAAPCAAGSGELALLGPLGRGLDQVQHQRVTRRLFRLVRVATLQAFGAGLGSEQRQICDAALALFLDALVDAVLTQPLQLQPLPLLAFGIGTMRGLLALPFGELLLALALLLDPFGVVALAIMFADGTAFFRAIAQRAGHPVVAPLAPTAEPTRLDTVRGFRLELPAGLDLLTALAQPLGERILVRAQPPEGERREAAEQRAESAQRAARARQRQRHGAPSDRVRARGAATPPACAPLRHRGCVLDSHESGALAHAVQ
jgi:hypothetical protein